MIGCDFIKECDIKGQIWDIFECGCVDACPDVNCKPNYSPNVDTCECECSITQSDCPFGSSLDYDTCECSICSENEEFRCDNPYCEATCETFGDPCTTFIKKCEDRCYCEPGFVRTQSVNGSCIELSSCPQTTTTAPDTTTDCSYNNCDERFVINTTSCSCYCPLTEIDCPVSSAIIDLHSLLSMSIC